MKKIIFYLILGLIASIITNIVMAHKNRELEDILKCRTRMLEESIGQTDEAIKLAQYFRKK